MNPTDPTQTNATSIDFTYCYNDN